MSDALTAEINATKKVLGKVEFADKSFDVVRKPSTLMIAELARTGSGDPEAIGVVAELLSHCFGEGYRDFKKVAYEVEDDGESLFELIGQVIEVALGRPKD